MKSFSLSHALVNLSQSVNLREFKSSINVENFNSSILLSSIFKNIDKNILVITAKPDDASLLYEQLSFWVSKEIDLYHFTGNDTLPYDKSEIDIQSSRKRIEVISGIFNNLKNQSIIIASLEAVSQKTISNEILNESIHILKAGDSISVDSLISKWTRIGYENDTIVYGPGMMSRRGGILDLYPVGLPNPVRIEFLGNQIESIREFDVNTQRSLKLIDSVCILPASEYMPQLKNTEWVNEQIQSLDWQNISKKIKKDMKSELTNLVSGFESQDSSYYLGFFNQQTIIDHFRKEDLIIFFDYKKIIKSSNEQQFQYYKSKEIKLLRKEVPKYFPSSVVESDKVIQSIASFPRNMKIFISDKDKSLVADSYNFIKPPLFYGDIKSFCNQINNFVLNEYKIILISAYTGRLLEALKNYDIGILYEFNFLQEKLVKNIYILQTESINTMPGFILDNDENKIIVLSDIEIFGFSKHKISNTKIRNKSRPFFTKIDKGDYMVHIDHGIGKFLEIGFIPGEEEGEEYFILEYDKKDKIYVPMNSLDRVSPYVAPSQHLPRLTRLGTKEWSKSKQKATDSSREIAASLLSIYAKREMSQGVATSLDTKWQEELEKSFKFQETDDQIKAINEVKSDMESSLPMDRLICGDVGYGKTEVALRAAFKSVMAGKQVALLAPTTVLSQQHYETFRERLTPYSTNIQVLSRFRSKKEQNLIINGLLDGSVDICIGTHRLIQKDVNFKNLGLVIIDEEQRFGVEHKERFKSMRSEIDILTMTATPIPRTLHMSLAGVRDMSVIETPPDDRSPIKTYIYEFSDSIIKQAIVRELDREGQVFFVHNRVQSIDYFASYLNKLVPSAKIGIAHGQMPENELEFVMKEFARSKIDILVCTTIIESGLDLANVNTLIVNKADTFGLSQLYQLRGRVGRGSKKAYAYFLSETPSSININAQNRLRAILDLKDIGGGFQVAMKDLEIRGAGNVLGSEQSGHIQAIGFDLYNKLLAYAVDDLKSTTNTENDNNNSNIKEDPLNPAVKTMVQLDISSNIPSEYIYDIAQRIDIYQRLSKMKYTDDWAGIRDELSDRFGELPGPVKNLLYINRVVSIAKELNLKSIVRKEKKFFLTFIYDIGGAKKALQKCLTDSALIGSNRLTINSSEDNSSWKKELLDILIKLIDFNKKFHI